MTADEVAAHAIADRPANPVKAAWQASTSAYTAMEHRNAARLLLGLVDLWRTSTDVEGSVPIVLAAAQVHATLAISAPTFRGEDDAF